MEKPVLYVRMFGQFKLSYDGKEIDDSFNRSKKVWLLLAYLIYNRNRLVPQEELINLLNSKEGTNPMGALKTTLHRTRLALDPLFPNAGHELILHRNGGYIWSDAYPVQLDMEQMDQLCREAATQQDPEQQLQLWLQAVELFSGDFLKKLSSEIWVVPISAYYHRLYLNTVLKLLAALESRAQHQLTAQIAENACLLEPHQEELHQYWMNALVQLGEQKKVVQIYEELCKNLQNDFGVMPDEKTRTIYRKALKIINRNILHLDTVRAQLEEKSSAPGAMICEYDFFRVLYQAEARAIVRNGNAVHIALLTVLNQDGEDLPQRSLDRAMHNLQEQIRINLRKGDIASRCSVSQFIIMLPQANYENSCMVCRRIITAFNRKYPHASARIDYVVQPLEPNV